MQVLHSEFLPFPLEQKHMLLVALVFCCSSKRQEKLPICPKHVLEKSPGTHNPPRAWRAWQCSSQEETFGLDMLHFMTGGPKLFIFMHHQQLCAAAARTVPFCASTSLQTDMKTDTQQETSTGEGWHGGTLNVWSTS